MLSAKTSEPLVPFLVWRGL